MANESGDKVQDRQRHNFSSIGIMVEVLIRNGFSIVVFDASFTDRGRLRYLPLQISVVSQHWLSYCLTVS